MLKKTIVVILPLILCVTLFAIALGSIDEPINETSEPTLKEGNNEDKKSIYNFLVMGKDQTSGLFDVIIVVSYDTEKQQINALQIPRDTYASYTSSAYRKINGAVYSLGGEEAFAEFLSSTLGIKIDHYVTTDLDTIAKTIDKLGGIDVFVPEDMKYKDPYQDLTIDIKAGRQRLNGIEATHFLRYRSGYVTGDLGRLDAQKIFLAALVKKILIESELSDMIGVAISILGDVKSDLTVADCVFFVSKISELEIENIGFMTMPGGAICSQSGAWYYIINREAAYETVKKYFVQDLAEGEFDKNTLFTSVYRQGFNEIYYAKNKYKTERFTAEQICEEGINID